ncbi:MAG TPA: NAD-dependent epimerase/dehydratase family protein [Candidatus Marinimicrobia bacterium]|nr:NAD-dependent epimerase/dehydratase family protein [Nitrospirales bacterium]HIO73768.1 NAD-dependent epimerase/dehydratase family protein [Candidatus Neomarinimicrobiota bacterium]
MNVLITGASGFTGRNLYSLLLKEGSFAVYTSDIFSDDGHDNYFCCDLTSRDSSKELVVQTEPDLIYHLAGTFSSDYETGYAANVLTTRNVLEAVRTGDKRCRVLLIGSAAEYGVTYIGENPVKETKLLKPASIYGLMKVYQTHLMKYYVHSFDVDVVMARTFNIYGKGISDNLFVGRVYQQIQMLKNGGIEKIQLGNLDNERDYISIEEATRHYVTIMQRGEKGEVYNVGKGIPVKTRTILEQILEEEGVDIRVVESVTSKRDQIYDVPQIYADVSKLKQLSGVG